MIIRVVDVETTGMPPDAGVCEIAWCDVADLPPYPPEEEARQWGIHAPISTLVDPCRPIPPEAQAIHHIGDRDVIGAPKPVRIFERMLEDHPIFCAHNAKFERNFFDGPEYKWICTLKVGRRLWPECPSHSNQCLRYYLGLDLDPVLAMPPHRAGPDAYVTAHILVKALGLATVPEMIEWTKQPSLLPRCPFGKHKGKGWHEVPDDYLDWVVRQKDMDEDVIFTAKHNLKTRVF